MSFTAEKFCPPTMPNLTIDKFKFMVLPFPYWHFHTFFCCHFINQNKAGNSFMNQAKLANMPHLDKHYNKNLDSSASSSGDLTHLLGGRVSHIWPFMWDSSIDFVLWLFLKKYICKEDFRISFCWLLQHQLCCTVIGVFNAIVIFLYFYLLLICTPSRTVYYFR